MDSKKASFESNHKELSASSSNEFNEVLEFTVSNYETLQQQKELGSRRSSVHRKSLEAIKKCITGESNYESPETKDYSVHHIYGDLDSDAIEIQRTQTRNLILTKLESRVEDNTNNYSNDNHEHEVECQDTISVIPDTNIEIAQHGKEFDTIDPELITWNGPDDTEDPRNWPINKKIFLLGFVSLYALVAPMSSSMLSPAMTFIAEDFHITSPII